MKDIHEEVQEYYGDTLQTSEDLQTNACCTLTPPPKHIREALSLVADEVQAKYYGCGLTIPAGIDGLKILDLGSGSGRDCYIASKLVGENGYVIGVDMTDAQLIFCGRRVVRVARQQLDFLAETGVNENVIRRVAEATRQFEKSVNIQQDKVADRDISVERRVEQGNRLYDELITLCNIGKDVWAEKDPVRYENYCIYESNNEQKKARKTSQKSS